jgi:hypothetical protein
VCSSADVGWWCVLLRDAGQKTRHFAASARSWRAVRVVPRLPPAGLFGSATLGCRPFDCLSSPARRSPCRTRSRDPVRFFTTTSGTRVHTVLRTMLAAARVVRRMTRYATRTCQQKYLFYAPRCLASLSARRGKAVTGPRAGDGDARARSPSYRTFSKQSADRFLIPLITVDVSFCEGAWNQTLSQRMGWQRIFFLRSAAADE